MYICGVGVRCRWACAAGFLDLCTVFPGFLTLLALFLDLCTLFSIFPVAISRFTVHRSDYFAFSSILQIKSVHRSIFLAQRYAGGTRLTMQVGCGKNEFLRRFPLGEVTFAEKTNF